MINFVYVIQDNGKPRATIKNPAGTKIVAHGESGRGSCRGGLSKGIIGHFVDEHPNISPDVKQTPRSDYPSGVLIGVFNFQNEEQRVRVLEFCARNNIKIEGIKKTAGL